MSVEYIKPIGRLGIAVDQRRRYEIKKGDGGWAMYDALVDVEKNKEAVFPSLRAEVTLSLAMLGLLKRSE